MPKRVPVACECSPVQNMVLCSLQGSLPLSCPKTELGKCGKGSKGRNKEKSVFTRSFPAACQWPGPTPNLPEFAPHWCFWPDRSSEEAPEDCGSASES